MEKQTRERVIDQLREYLVRLTDEKHSMCEVAGSLGLYCRGFQRLSDGELRERFNWMLRTRPGTTHQQLEDLANRHVLARQKALGVSFACDALSIDRDTCLGWDEFSNADLQRFYRECYEENIEIQD
jgi:AraC-like DNA-binding protein